MANPSCVCGYGSGCVGGAEPSVAAGIVGTPLDMLALAGPQASAVPGVPWYIQLPAGAPLI
jgi:hypothetical protein